MATRRPCSFITGPFMTRFHGDWNCAISTHRLSQEKLMSKICQGISAGKKKFLLLFPSFLSNLNLLRGGNGNKLKWKHPVNFKSYSTEIFMYFLNWKFYLCNSLQLLNGFLRETMASEEDKFSPACGCRRRLWARLTVLVHACFFILGWGWCGFTSLLTPDILEGCVLLFNLEGKIKPCSNITWMYLNCNWIFKPYTCVFHNKCLLFKQ